MLHCFISFLLPYLSTAVLQGVCLCFFHPTLFPIFLLSSKQSIRTSSSAAWCGTGQCIDHRFEHLLLMLPAATTTTTTATAAGESFHHRSGSVLERSIGCVLLVFFYIPIHSLVNHTMFLMPGFR
uniref:Putative secreted peptide n=1 Tax=Anopheles braziliensis TaxID=58242 RepID=A0A2M3ZSM0_9DIPT